MYDLFTIVIIYDLRSDLLFSQESIEFLAVVLKLGGVELTVVHLFAEVDDALEVIDDIEEVIEIVVVFADVHNEVKHILLALERTNGVDLIEGILLEDDEVNHFGFPERLVVITIGSHSLSIKPEIYSSNSGYSTYLEYESMGLTAG